MGNSTKDKEVVQGQDRTPRDIETRDTEMRKTSWNRPELLPNPTPAEGFVYRWIRLSMAGQNDAMNVSSKLREGWEPVPAKEHPEIAMAVVESERFKDNIVIGGLMLCRAPVEMVAERDAFYSNMTKQQMSSVDNNLMRENDPRMPLFNESRSKVTFGSGN